MFVITPNPFVTSNLNVSATSEPLMVSVGNRNDGWSTALHAFGYDKCAFAITILNRVVFFSGKKGLLEAHM